MKISTRLLLSFLFFVMLPLTLLSYFDLQQNESSLRAAALDLMSDLADKKVIQVNTYLEERAHDVRSMANGELAEKGMFSLAHAYKEHHPNSLEYKQLARKLDEEIAEFIDESSPYYDAFLITPLGDIVYTYKHEADFATNLLTGPYRDSPLGQVFRESSMTLENSISGFEPYAPSGQPAAFVAAPIFRNGKFVGMVALQLKINRIYEMAGDQVGLGQSGETVLSHRIDEQHAMYIAPLKRNIELDLLKPRDFARVPLIMRQALAGMNGSAVAKDYRGIPVVASWRYLPGLNWGMVVKMDADEMFAPFYHQRTVMLEVLIGVMLFVLLLAYFFGRQLTDAIEALAKTANEVAAGNLNRRADETATGELGIFAGAFNRMAKSLQSSYQTLEERIHERTIELNTTNAQLQEEVTERARIEKNLLAANDELSIHKRFMDSSSNAMCMTLLNGKMMYGNSALCELLGISMDELSLHSLQEFFSGEDLAELLEVVLPNVVVQGSWRGELRICDFQSGLHDVLLDTHAVVDAAGKPFALANILSDITERKQAELVLREHKTAIEIMHDGFWIMNMKGYLLEANQAYVKLSGFSMEELLGMHISQLEAKELSQEVINVHIAKIIFMGYDVYETRHRHKDGHEIELEVSTSFIRESQRFVLFFRDITQRKRAESILKRHKVAIETVHDGFWMVSEEGFLLETNQAYADMSGYSLDELRGMHFSDLEAKEQSIEEVKAHIAKIIAQGYDIFETRHRHKDGHEIDVEVSTSFMTETNQFVVFSHDISKRKQVQVALEKSKLQYDRLVANIPIGVYLVHTTPAGVFDFKYVSPRFCTLLNVAEEDVYRDAWVPFRAIHPEEIDEFKRSNDEALQTHRPFMWEGRVLVNGIVRWLRIESGPELLPNGDCLWDGMMTDITERYLARNELLSNQRLLNEAQRLGQIGSWELNLVSNESLWSEELFHLVGLDPTQAVPSYENFLKVVHPGDRELVNKSYTESLVNHQSYDLEHRLLMGDGSLKWVRVHCASDYDDLRSAVRSFGTVQDITAQKQVEERLRISAVAFETHEGIMITDRQANILRVNQAFQEITGYSSEDVLGKNPSILSSGRESKDFYKEMWRQLLEIGTWSGEIWDRRKNGEIYPKWLTISSVKNRDEEISEFVAVFSDITARKKAEEEIRNLAFFDALTGLPNRRLLLDRFQLALSVSTRSHHCGALLFLDMDKFKTLNDTLGHDCGDLLLIEVGRRLQTCVREADTVSRLGGDEFVVLIEEISTNMEEASQKVSLIAEKIRAALTEPYALKEHQIHSSPSIGVSMYRGNLESMDTLMKHADMAMYQAKDAGRNRVRFFDPLMQMAVEARVLLEADLRGALPNRELQLYYQIQVDSDHRPIGAEALIRWIHPRRGLVSPAQFIPVAEESGLILDVGLWVMEDACRTLAEWSQTEELQHMILAINVSAHQFRLHNFVDQLHEILIRHDIDPNHLKLELTESVVLEDVADVVIKMHALKALGVRLSLDDFGTGYSSLAYLKQLPLDQIKIDQSFVRDITTDPNDAVMVKTIIDLAHNFRLAVIAEGVETEAQLAFLKQSGCTAHQGYLFSRPIPVTEFEALAKKLLERE